MTYRHTPCFSQSSMPLCHLALPVVKRTDSSKLSIYPECDSADKSLILNKMGPSICRAPQIC